MRIPTALGIVLCSGLAYTACGSDDDKNPLAADVNNAQTSDAGGDDNNTETPDADSIVDISGALFSEFDANCATYANWYISSVMDVQNGSRFDGNLKISVSGDKCLFASNAIPNHDFNASGNFATRASAQDLSYEIPVSPTVAASVTHLVMGDDAVFLNGVKLDLFCRCLLTMWDRNLWA